MAEATFLHLIEIEDDPCYSDQTLTLDSLPYWSHNDFDLYASDPEFPPSDHSFYTHFSLHEDNMSDHRDCSTLRGLNDFSDPESISNTDLFDRENQVNFVMDLFQQRVEQSQVMGRTELLSEVLNESNFGVIEENYGVDMDGLGLGFDVGRDRDRVDRDDNGALMVKSFGLADNVDDDDFFIERRVSGSKSGEGPSTVCGVQPFENCVRLAGFGSDSDEEENVGLGICVQSDDEYNVHEANDDVLSLPLCWESLQLDEHRENNEDFEWEEVDGRFDEREVSSMFTAEGERSVYVTVSPIVGTGEEEVSVLRVGGLENLAWWESPHLDDLYPLEYDDDMDQAEYEMFADNQNPLNGCPKSVVQNLPFVVLTKEDVENDKALCAICKDDFIVGEEARKLPCAHRYHNDCILPWLDIRNTCPICRYELPTDDVPTDDADYQRPRTILIGSW